MESAFKISKSRARDLWIAAQGLYQRNYFGSGADAVGRVVEHLGYVQIDTINVIERCHHHILYSRIPDYRQSYLVQAQSQDKTVFEYWTHALAYVPTKDFRFFRPRMEKNIKSPHSWYDSVKPADLRKVLNMIKRDGPISIRDIKDDILVEKDHEWASRKPSKKALQLAFNQGKLVISERVGMLKKYELFDRHFNWQKKPKPASEKELNEYQLQRALRSQALVSLESICHLEPSRKPAMNTLIQTHADRKTLVAVQIEGLEKTQLWMRPEVLDTTVEIDTELTHILSPFDPLIIQRKRLNHFFDYQHLFEAYIPKEKRVYGYFSLPVMIGNKIVAVMDLKTDRQAKKLLIQSWTWLPKQKSARHKRQIEAELHRFESFQLRKN